MLLNLQNKTKSAYKLDAELADDPCLSALLQIISVGSFIHFASFLPYTFLL